MRKPRSAADREQFAHLVREALCRRAVVRVAYQIEIGETTANADVVMNLGDTLVLSGLSEKSTSSV